MSIVASGQITLTDLNDSKQLVSYIGASRAKTVIHNPDNNTYVPNYATANQVLTPQLFIAGTNADVASQAKSTKWYYQTNSAGTPVEITASGGGYTLGTGAVKTLTITANVLASATTMTYICETVFTDVDTGFDVITKAEIELVRVTNGKTGVDGKNAITAVLTNDAHVIPTDENGGKGVFGGANTEMIIYNGTVNDSTNWTVTATPSSGVTGSLSGRTYTVTGMTVDTGYVDLTASRSGYSSITKRFQLSKNKQGISGQSPTSYWMISSAPVIRKDRNGAYNPTSVKFTAKSQTGSGVPSDFNARFFIEESTDGTTWVKKYETPATESSRTHTPSANVKMVRAKLYLPTEVSLGGGSGLIDEQTINIVEDGQHGYTPQKGVDYFDGKDGQNGESAYLWIRYSQNANGNPMSTSPTDAKYIGTATTTEPSAPSSYASYKWTLIKGADGIKGEDGADGRSSYLHIKYSNDGGVTFTANGGETLGKWIGTYVDFTEADSTDPKKYTWNKVVGEDGLDAVVAMVWTPEGNTLKNSEGTLKASVTLYKGTSEVTGSAFKWYIQDPSATTSSGGDADGGAGWRLLTSTYNAGVTGYTTATITIPASAIASVESFKCVATYGGKKYKDVCTVIDVTDPIVVSVIGLSTFKNGQGSTELTAKLYRNGAEIDSAGIEYKYSWSIYNKDNQKTSFSKTGKTITVSADDIDVRGNVICEVSKA